MKKLEVEVNVGAVRSYSKRSRDIMTEQSLDDWGTSLGWDEIDKIYSLAGIQKCWLDYSYPEPIDPEHSWDQDKYYAEFDAWWVGLSYENKTEYYNQIIHN